MGYYNPILHYGLERFAIDAAAAGLDGTIVVDLPPEEDGELAPFLNANGLHMVRLATPTTDAARLPRIVGGASGFVYYVAVAGITGTTSASDTDIGAAVARLKAATPLPIAVGFGIKTPADAAAVARHADGVVVGSAIVSLIRRRRRRARQRPARHKSKALFARLALRFMARATRRLPNELAHAPAPAARRTAQPPRDAG